MVKIRNFDVELGLLRLSQDWANTFAVCQKVKVGAVIVGNEGDIFTAYGCNRSIPEGCDGTSCNRVLPHDGLPHCVSTLHAEIDAIIGSERNLEGTTIYVTRYPCENCARAIVRAGIKKVVYGRTPEISEDTKRIFEYGKVKVVHRASFNPEEE